MLKLLLYTFIFFVSFCYSEEDFYYKEYMFAKNLIVEGDYQRAITSLKRLNSFYPENDNFIENLYLISKCYFLDHKYLESKLISEEILKLDKSHWPSIIQSLKSFQKLDYYYESNIFINEHKNNFQFSKFDTLIFSSVINYIHLDEIDVAKNILKQHSPSIDFQNKKEEFLFSLNNNYPKNFKNKKIATLYSLIPGGGYVYTKHYETALSALLVNLLFYKATYDAYNTKNYGVGHFCSFLSFSFYFGSMTGSWQLVDKHNKRIKRSFANKFLFF